MTYVSQPDFLGGLLKPSPPPRKCGNPRGLPPPPKFYQKKVKIQKKCTWLHKLQKIGGAARRNKFSGINLAAELGTPPPRWSFHPSPKVTKIRPWYVWPLANLKHTHVKSQLRLMIFWYMIMDTESILLRAKKPANNCRFFFLILAQYLYRTNERNWAQIL